MKKEWLLTIGFTPSTSLCIAQQNKSIQYLDSLSSAIDKDSSLLVKVVNAGIDPLKDSTNKVLTYHIKQKSGIVSKIEETGLGKFKLNIDYYFTNRNLFKIVVRSRCREAINWNSMFYFENGNNVYQIDYGTPLYAPAFKQLADSLIKKFQQ